MSVASAARQLGSFEADKVYSLRATNKNSGSGGHEYRVRVDDIIAAAIEEIRERHKGDYKFAADVWRNGLAQLIIAEADDDPSNRRLTVAAMHFRSETRMRSLEHLSAMYDNYVKLIGKSREVPARIDELRQDLLRIISSLSPEYEDWRGEFKELLHRLP